MHAMQEAEGRFVVHQIPAPGDRAPSGDLTLFGVAGSNHSSPRSRVQQAYCVLALLLAIVVFFVAPLMLTQWV
jgi:hypothetical protein